jgi:DNA-binding CsgD family transcriptional regulator
MNDLDAALEWIAAPEDRRAIVEAARASRPLYAAIFASLGELSESRRETSRPPRGERMSSGAPASPGAPAGAGSPRSLPPDAERVLGSLMEGLSKDQGLELVWWSPEMEVTRSRGATELIRKWFPGARGEDGLPDELRGPMVRLAGAPPEAREEPLQLCGEHGTLRVTFIRANRFCAAVLKEIAPAPPVPARWQEILTAREQEVAALVLKGWDYALISEQLGCRPWTVTKHVQHIFDKLGVPTRMKLRLLADEALATAG